MRLGPSRAVAVGPGLRYRLEGEAAVGVLTLSTELVHEARRTEHVGSSRRPPSPEYDPESGGDGPRGGVESCLEAGPEVAKRDPRDRIRSGPFGSKSSPSRRVGEPIWRGENHDDPAVFALAPARRPRPRLLIALAHGTIASAQGHTPDPYRPYNSVYDPYVYPDLPQGRRLFPQSRPPRRPVGPGAGQPVPGLPRRDSPRQRPDPSGLSRSGGAGTPYYRAHRRFNPENRPNNSEADRLFREKQEERDTRYFEARKKYQEAVNERNPQKRARLIKEYAAAKRLAEQDFQSAREPSAPGQRSAIGPREPANPPAPRRPQDAGPRPSSSPVAPAPPRETALPGTARPRSSPPPPRPGRVGSPPAARTPSQILRESESLDRSDRSPTPPPRPRLQPSPAPR